MSRLKYLRINCTLTMVSFQPSSTGLHAAVLGQFLNYTDDLGPNHKSRHRQLQATVTREAMLLSSTRSQRCISQAGYCSILPRVCFLFMLTLLRMKFLEPRMYAGDFYWTVYRSKWKLVREISICLQVLFPPGISAFTFCCLRWHTCLPARQCIMSDAF